ncbi:MAG: serine/threonine-protein kinase [Byssovorax sp.]
MPDTLPLAPIRPITRARAAIRPAVAPIVAEPIEEAPVSSKNRERFKLRGLSASGGMGAVYRALDRHTGRLVAIKVLRGYSEEHAFRFAREASVLASLRHRGIVRYVQHGKLASGDRYLAMEWLEGETLASRLRRGPLSVDETLLLGSRIADALAVTHEHGVIHRDLKPANLFLEHRSVGRVKILDFGLARARGGELELTAPGAMLGTPGYMSPEQLRGERIMNASSDIFALGCVLFKCLTGRSVFADSDGIDALFRVLYEEAPRVSSLCLGVPPALDDLIARMLAKSPSDRPEDASAVWAALSAIGAERWKTS